MAGFTTAAYTGAQSFTAQNAPTQNYNQSNLNTLTLSFTQAPTITFTTASTYSYGQNFQAMAISKSTGTFTYSR